MTDIKQLVNIELDFFELPPLKEIEGKTMVLKNCMFTDNFIMAVNKAFSKNEGIDQYLKAGERVNYYDKYVTIKLF